MRRIKTGGRRRGTPNKMTVDVKLIIMGALEKAGGVEYLAQQAEKNPVAFMALLGKVLPLAVASEGTSERLHVTQLSDDELMVIAAEGRSRASD